MRQHEAEQGEADPAGQKHVGHRGTPPADPSRAEGQHGAAQQGTAQEPVEGLGGRSNQQQHRKHGQHGGARRQRSRQAGCPFAYAKQAEAEPHHPVAPHGVVEEQLTVPTGGDPIPAHQHLPRDFDKQSLGLVHQAKPTELLPKQAST